MVIPSWGGAERLPKVLASLAVQSHPDVEIVLVLDGVVDGSRAVAERWQHLLNLNIIQFSQDRGRVAALNAGLTAATGDVLIRWDDDLMTSPDHVAQHASHHVDADRPVGAIGLCPNDSPETPYVQMYGRAMERNFGQFALGLPASDLWRLWGPNVSVTRETWERVGPYDSRTQGQGFEDVDWGYRLHTLGIGIVFDPGLEALHHETALSARRTLDRALASRVNLGRRHVSSAHAGRASKSHFWASLPHNTH